MGELDLATVAAANDAWVLTPEGSDVVETAEYRLVRFPERFANPVRVQWVRSARPAEGVLDDVFARAAAFGFPEAYVYARPSAPNGFDEALLKRGAELLDTADVLAMALPADSKTPDLPVLELRWRTTPAVARDANTVGASAFGWETASDDVLARHAAADSESIAGEIGGTMAAYLDGTPVAVAGVKVVDGVARLWGGAVLEAYRGQGIYRALVDARLTYATERGATMTLTHGRTATSSPILRRLGFVSYGQERTYRLPLA